MQFLKESDIRLKSWLKIVDVILEGYLNRELYEKVQFSPSTCISLMHLFHKNKRDCIYCLEQQMCTGNTIIVMAGFFQGNELLTPENFELLSQVEKYEYEIHRG